MKTEKTRINSLQFNIVLFWFMNDWGLYGRAYEKIAENLAKISLVQRVICLFPPVDRTSFSWPIRIQKADEKLYVVVQNKGFLKAYRRPYRIRQWINKMTLNYLSKRFFKKLKISSTNTILWLYPPHQHIEQILLTIPHNFVVTQIIDNNTFRDSDSSESKSFVERQYRELARKSDVVITSSRLNYDIFSRLNNNCGFFENAVDSSFIAKPSKLPHLITSYRARLGYVGFISERTDIELMHYIAKERPHYDLIIAGPQEGNLTECGILDLPNVSYLGAIPYNDVPEFLQSIDVCLIPHKDTLYSKSMSPLKLFQYLGSGRPIVSTSISGADRFRELISVADSYDEFIKCIDENLTKDNEVLSKERICVAQNETWENRVKEIFEFVLEKIDT